MKWRIILLAIVLWLAPLGAEACPFYRDLVQDVRGNVVTGASVTINVAGTTTLASVYTDALCAVAASNPITTGSDGTFSIFLPSGYYDVVPAKSGYTFASVPRVQVFEPLGDFIATIADFSTTDLTAIGTGAFDQIGSNIRTLLINKPALATLDDTCPSTLTLLFMGTGTLTLSSGKTMTMNCRVVNLTEHAVLLGSGTYTKAASSVGSRSFWMPASILTTDGTQCANPARVTLNGGPAIHTIVCTDNDASSIYGVQRMPPDWDGGTVTLAASYVQTAADTNAMHSDVAMQCRGLAEVVSSTWGTEIALDDAAVTGSSGVDQTTTIAVTPAGTCAPGDMLWFRWQLDAAGTTTAVATLHILGFTLTYTRDPNVPMTE